MNNRQALSYIQAEALTPDQLLSYVSAVSEVESELINDYLIHKKARHYLVIGYSLNKSHNIEDIKPLDEVIGEILKRDDCDSIAVLSPIRPNIAPKSAITSEKDDYYFLSLPLEKLGQKVRNMLNRAMKEVYITKKTGKEAWTGAHQEMMLSYIGTKGMEAGLCTIMQGLEKYLIAEEESMLFSAYSKENNTLLAYAIADFSSFSTAFYMFAFKQEDANLKVPGVADAVLFALLEEASNRGYSQCNLGLGINAGIKFFKEKWGAKPSLSFVETSWKKNEIKQDNNKKKKSFFSSLFAKNKG